jgi:CheY-like chemotaxis protein
LCYGLIKEHGGNITPMSKPGEGATFVIELPIARGVDVAKPQPQSETRKPNSQEGAGKRILVIDDEEMLLNMMREELNLYGYDVVTAIDGESGLRETKQNHFDAAIFDWKMPGLNGRQVYEQLRATKPDFCRRVIFVTGDVVNEPMRKFLEEEKCPCLTKPFALADLRDVIKSVLTTR